MITRHKPSRVLMLALGRFALLVLAIVSILIGPISVTGYNNISCDSSYGRSHYVEVADAPVIERISRNQTRASAYIDYCTGNSSNAVIIVRCSGSGAPSFWSALRSPVEIFGLDPEQSYSCSAAVANEAGQSPWSPEVLMPVQPPETEEILPKLPIWLLYEASK